MGGRETNQTDGSVGALVATGEGRGAELAKGGSVWVGLNVVSAGALAAHGVGGAVETLQTDGPAVEQFQHAQRYDLG